MTGQAEVIAFLSDPASYGTGIERVDIHETHAALIFLAGEDAYKIKKAVRYPYLDFSTLAKRRAVCQREYEINQPHAPQIYRGVVPVSRSDDGRLHLGGAGDPVEWCVHMTRFDGHAVLAAALAENLALPATLFADLAAVIVDHHAHAQPSRGGRRVIVNVDEICEAFANAPDLVSPQRLSALKKSFAAHLDTCHHRLETRRSRGYVRRCHGDLHLNNIVLLDGKPVLFDAIEFDENVATIDILYDLAFLIMDLEHNGQRVAGNHLLNRYLALDNDAANISGLQAMPLFLALRAGIRAMVEITRMRQVSDQMEAQRCRAEIDRYLQLAEGFLTAGQPQLVCIAGLSGTGKTTVARALAPQFGHAPGAVHLRSDVERKAMFGVGETERLAATAYTREISDIIYRRLFHKAKLALLAGRSVIIDAVFLTETERHAAAELAHGVGTSFTGIWLKTDEGTMRRRVAARTGDASDATEDVVLKQIGTDPGEITWPTVDASGTSEQTVNLCRSHLAQGSAKPFLK